MAEKPKRPKLKPSEKLMGWAMLLGTAVAGGVYWIFGGAHWAVLVFVWFAVTVGAYNTWLETAYRERIIDGD